MAQSVSFDIRPEKEASKLRFFRRQFFDGAPPVFRSDVDLNGKTAIVTGANGGLGLECCRQLLDLGVGNLIMAVRDEAKGGEARKRLLAERELEVGQDIHIWKLDHASYESITAFAQRAEIFRPRLDIAILNAGINRGPFVLNPATGHEEDLQVNYLSSVLLLLLLLRVFQRAQADNSTDSLTNDTTNNPTNNPTNNTNNPTTGSTPGRLVLVSSDTAAWAKFKERTRYPLLPAFDDKNAKWENFDRYATTKLLGQLFLTQLTKHVPSSVAIVNCANPGLCYGSRLPRDLGRAVAIGVRIVGRSPVVGARSIIHAAVKQGESSHGQYIEDGVIRPMAPFVYSEEAIVVTRRLWKETMEELAFAGAQGIVDNLGESRGQQEAGNSRAAVAEPSVLT
ncbi:NAD(P)-binding protein [Xylariomycetidae sp. FL0641]|nr:NAD(P)-binding protein [Xylariomycetidae sp. FL0641]